MGDVIGWISSLILMLTIAKQIHKQWKDDTSAGVSKWLFIGQMASEIGFVVYSWQVGNWVFVATNFLLFCANLVGAAIVYRQWRQVSAFFSGF